MKKARLYTDGGSRGNPGPAAAGYVLYDLSDNDEGDVLAQGGEYLGETTNNQAEYYGVIYGMKKALELGVTHLEVRMDSELAVKQLNGIYKVKNPGIAERFFDVHQLRSQFSSIQFAHVRRERNTVADAMVNQSIDAALAV